MEYENVLDYYNSLAVNNYEDINNYSIRLANEGKEKYIKWVMENEKEMYYLVDSSNEDYIIGYGSIENPKLLDFH